MEITYMIKQLSTMTCVALLSACAQMPEVSIGYYLPQSEVVITVTQSAACLKKDNNWKGYVHSNIIYNTEYSADTVAGSNALYTLDLSKLDAWHGKSDIKFELTDDNRLASVNSTNEGRVGSYIKEVAKTFSLAGIGLEGINDGPHPCEFLVTHNKAKSGKGNEPTVMSITLVGRDNFRKGNPIVFNPIDLDQETYALVRDKIFGPIEATYTVYKSQPKIIFQADNYKGEKLAFREPATVKVTTRVRDVLNNTTHIREADILAPHLGPIYYLPLQKPPLFGNNSMALKINGNGKVTSLEYGSDALASGVLGSINNAYETLHKDGSTTAEKANELKAQADLIAQSERLAKCQITPQDCSL